MSSKSTKALFRPYLSESEILWILEKSATLATPIEVSLHKKLIMFKIKMAHGIVAPQLQVQEKKTIEESLGLVQESKPDSTAYLHRLEQLPSDALSPEDRFNLLGMKEERSQEEEKEFLALQKQLYGF